MSQREKRRKATCQQDPCHASNQPSRRSVEFAGRQRTALGFLKMPNRVERGSVSRSLTVEVLDRRVGPSRAVLELVLVLLTIAYAVRIGQEGASMRWQNRPTQVEQRVATPKRGFANTAASNHCARSTQNQESFSSLSFNNQLALTQAAATKGAGMPANVQDLHCGRWPGQL